MYLLVNTEILKKLNAVPTSENHDITITQLKLWYNALSEKKKKGTSKSQELSDRIGSENALLFAFSPNVMLAFYTCLV